MSVCSRTLLLCGVCLSTPSFDLYLFLHPIFFPILCSVSAPHSLVLTQSRNNLLSCLFSHLLSLSLIFIFYLLFLLVKAFTSFSLFHAYPHLYPPPALLPTSPLLPLTLLLGIVLCFLAIHPLPFISHCSASPCVFYLSLYFSILAHLPSYNPFCLWLLCKFPHFLSLCLIPSLSFSLSCLPLRQPEYDNVISHSSTSPPSPLFFPSSTSSASVFLSCLSIACWLCCPPRLLASAAPTFSHKLRTHMHTHTLRSYVPHTPLCSILCHTLPVSEARSLLALPFLPRLPHLSNFLTHPSFPSALSLDFPMPPFFSHTSPSPLLPPPSTSLKSFLYRFCISLSPSSLALLRE